MPNGFRLSGGRVTAAVP